MITLDNFEVGKVRPFLAKLYPKELLAMYLSLLEEWGKGVYTRPDYNKLATQMKSIKREIPKAKEAIDQLVASLKEQNPRRPAMREELNNVLRMS